MPAHLAIDLGASSGRAIVGTLHGDPLKLRLEEVHRFEHRFSPTPQGPVWDLTGIWRNILTGLSRAAAWSREHAVEIKSVGVDTWGVDFALVGASGELRGLPHCYRDPQNTAADERVVEKLGGFERLYERTGIQRMPLNTINQLAARHAADRSLVESADRLLFMPDLFHYWLSGVMATEQSIASTSSMVNVRTGEWDRGLVEELGLPPRLLGPIVEPGSELGVLRKEVADETGADPALRVVAPATHDTASAIAAVPATGGGSWAYISSGTWSLMGAELRAPLISDASRQAPFTHERGVHGTIRFLKNIAGLWLVQELRREMAESGEAPSFAELTVEAEAAPPYRTLINPDWTEFALAGGMAKKIRGFARETGQAQPETTGQLVRCCLESLSLVYRRTLNLMEPIIGHKVETLHIVGGGVQNRLLNRLTATAIGRPVVCGPVEATAVGNVLVQAVGCGALTGLADLRRVVRNSFEVERFEPDAPLPPGVAERFDGLAPS